MSSSVFERLQKILAEQFEIDEDDITLNSDIVDDLGADSLDLVDLVMSIEDEFEIEVPDEAIEEIKTVDDAVKYIEDHE
ncbi:MAG: acyl carrier protein [Clostridiaceae bacterium]|nr:acyl carrier protein [Clostridiaceae bacterium]MDD6704679.1 acyl carrier protein [Clostridiaceae bacterium]MDD7615369.1 acyl carrier protein [Clostridiaceae bacterium]MDY5889142.1 acyl carrier protein [Oscillospiraceae bacterium]MDY5934947.1 acyl carrier protein [Oscillospiraceae bacterium]